MPGPEWLDLLISPDNFRISTGEEARVQIVGSVDSAAPSGRSTIAIGFTGQGVGRGVQVQFEGNLYFDLDIPPPTLTPAPTPTATPIPVVAFFDVFVTLQVQNGTTVPLPLGPIRCPEDETCTESFSVPAEVCGAEDCQATANLVCSGNTCSGSVDLEPCGAEASCSADVETTCERSVEGWTCTTEETIIVPPILIPPPIEGFPWNNALACILGLAALAALGAGLWRLGVLGRLTFTKEIPPQEEPKPPLTTAETGRPPITTTEETPRGCVCKLETDPDLGIQLRVTHPKPGTIPATHPIYLAAVATDVDKIKITCTEGESVSKCEVRVPQKTAIKWKIVSEKIEMEHTRAEKYDQTTKSWMYWSSAVEHSYEPEPGKLIGRYGEGREVEGEQALYYPAKGSERRFHGHKLRFDDYVDGKGVRHIIKGRLIATIECTANDHTWNLVKDGPATKEIGLQLYPETWLEYRLEVTGVDEAGLQMPGVTADCPGGGVCPASYRIEDVSALEIYEHINVWSGQYETDRSKYPPAIGPAVYQAQPVIVRAMGIDWDKVLGLCNEVESEECKIPVNDPVKVSWTADAGEFPCSKVAEQVIWVAPPRYGWSKLRADLDDVPIYDDGPKKDERDVKLKACRLIIYGHRRGVGHVAIGIRHWGEEIIWGLYPKGRGLGDMVTGVKGQIQVEDPNGWGETRWRVERLISEGQCRAVRKKIAELFQKVPDWYLLGYNCVDFVREAAAQAGVEVPSAGWLGSATELYEEMYTSTPQQRRSDYGHREWDEDSFPGD